MSLKLREPIRHPTIPTVLLPWLDARPVYVGTLMEYLGCEYDAIAGFARRGCFSGPGCTFPDLVDRGHPPARATRYIPCAIWRFNKWEPPAAVVTLLLSSDSLWASYATRLDQVAAAANGEPLPPAPGAPASLRLVTA